MTIEIAIAAGKGGTGKTFVASNLIYYASNIKHVRTIGIDCDVEAPDLALALGGEERILWEEEYAGRLTPRIDYSKCTKCGLCVKACLFNALEMTPEGPILHEELCEGLGACYYACPNKAIHLEKHVIGSIKAIRTSLGNLILYGELELGGEMAGSLITQLRNRAKEYHPNLTVIDCPPGIGCSVISSITGVNMLVIVVEPTKPSLQGALRLLENVRNLVGKIRIIINKFNLNLDFTGKIESEVEEYVVGKIPYDSIVYEAYANLTPILKYAPSTKISKILEDIVSTIIEEALECI